MLAWDLSMGSVSSVQIYLIVLTHGTLYGLRGRVVEFSLFDITQCPANYDIVLPCRLVTWNTSKTYLERFYKNLQTLSV